MACRIVASTQRKVLCRQLSSFQMVAPLVSHFLKGVLELGPSLPFYKDIWVVSVVFGYLKTLPPLEELNLKDITHKTALTISGMRITKDTVHFAIAYQGFLRT